MKRECVAGILVLVLSCFVAAADQAVAEIRTLRGEVQVLREGKKLPLYGGDKLYRSDVVITGEESSVGLIFEDNTVLSLGAKSKVVIQEFVFAPEKGVMSMILRLLKGTASYLSGIIGKQSPEKVKFNTPTATIGVRGTQFLVKVQG